MIKKVCCDVDGALLWPESLIFILLTGFTLIYIFFGLDYIIKDDYYIVNCKGSLLLSYMITTMVLAILRYLNIIGLYLYTKSNGPEKFLINFDFFISGVFELIISLWGHITIMVPLCESLVNTHIWFLACISVWIQTIVGIILIIPALYSLGKECIKMVKNKNPQPENYLMMS